MLEKHCTPICFDSFHPVLGRFLENIMAKVLIVKGQVASQEPGLSQPRALGHLNHHVHSESAPASLTGQALALRTVFEVEQGVDRSFGREHLTSDFRKDDYLSSLHFFLSFDGCKIWVIHQSKTNPTLLSRGGSVVAKLTVPNTRLEISIGDMIVAGQSRFELSEIRQLSEWREEKISGVVAVSSEDDADRVAKRRSVDTNTTGCGNRADTTAPHSNAPITKAAGTGSMPAIKVDSLADYLNASKPVREQFPLRETPESTRSSRTSQNSSEKRWEGSPNIVDPVGIDQKGEFVVDDDDDDLILDPNEPASEREETSAEIWGLVEESPKDEHDIFDV